MPKICEAVIVAKGDRFDGSNVFCVFLISFVFNVTQEDLYLV